LEDSDKQIQVVFNGEVIADTRRAKRVLETSHPPVYYVPPEDIRTEYLKPAGGQSWCEWKGPARYYSVQVAGQKAERAAWYYPDPTPGFESLRNYVAFYPGRMEACYVDGERVQAQAGDFYGGWITGDIVGPFKGGPGTMGW
jgi:uncharacterized protein (DUF427 family)